MKKLLPEKLKHHEEVIRAELEESIAYIESTKNKVWVLVVAVIFPAMLFIKQDQGSILTLWNSQL